ncbi:hypothetical protein Fcan01_27924 [Folsomia candida]|uniref:Uncharacterized protein n=1 Tax=Folsomia candida TaxID=158441 RepID=A0A226CWI7_FOLCA|nr:hypothetical protein Fcan01_27924 [Folsomia candida]
MFGCFCSTLSQKRHGHLSVCLLTDLTLIEEAGKPRYSWIQQPIRTATGDHNRSVGPHPGCHQPLGDLGRDPVKDLTQPEVSHSHSEMYEYPLPVVARWGGTKLQLCINFLYGAAEVTSLFLSVIISTLTILTRCQPIQLSCLFCKDGGLLTGQSHTTIYAIKLSFAILEFISLQQLVTTSVYYLATVLLHGISFLWMSCTTFVHGYTPAGNIAWLLAYKELKVYEKLLNYCTKSRIFLITALLVPGLQILLCYTSLKLFHSEHISNFEASLFLWAYFLVLVFTMLLFSAAAQINSLSVNWIAKFKGSGDKKLERRMHKSLMSLRLEFGNNFVETLTPLVVQEFCVRQTVSCLLVKR